MDLNQLNRLSSNNNLLILVQRRKSIMNNMIKA